MSRAADTPTARRVPVAMIFANGMILVDQTAVPLALPAIMQDLRVQSQAVQWVLNGSLLPLAGLLVFGGRIGDLLGRRRMFLLAVGGVRRGVGRRWSGADLPAPAVARVAQDAGGALMLPGSVALLSAAFPADEPRRDRQHIDLSGTVLLCVALVALVLGLSRTQGQELGSWQVLVPVALAVAAGVAFVARRMSWVAPAAPARDPVV